MTDAEFASHQQLQRDIAEQESRLEAASQAAAAAKASAKAKLATLGLSESEIAALIGA